MITTPAPRSQPVRARLRDHPVVVDVVVAAIALVVSLQAAGPGRPGESRVLAEIDPTSVVLCVLGSAALVARRIRPWWVWAFVATCGAVGVVATGGPSRALVPVTVAVYTLCTRVPLRPALCATLATAVVPFVLVLVTSDLGILEAFAYGFGPWNALAAVTGIAVRSQRAVIAAAHERVRLAEESRDEEARRRVSEERVRIARDLHDVVAHHIAVINVQAGVASHLIRSDPDQAAVALAHVREAGRVVLEEVPGLLGLLRGSGDDGSGLETAPAPRLSDLDQLVEQSRRSGLDVTVRRSGSPVDLGTGAELTAYRILQESLTNAARHGDGTALVSLDYDPRGCTVEVRNHRSATAVPAHAGAQHGLTGMRERATASGGTLTVGPADHDEWLVRYRLDLRPDLRGAGASA